MIEKIRNRFEQTFEERGVSPVIGVILMVAITVILAAAIGTFLLGFGDDFLREDQPQASVRITEEYVSSNSSYDVTVTAVSMQNADRIEVRPQEQKTKKLSSVGETAQFLKSNSEGVVDGNNIVVVAVKGDTERTIRVFTAGS